MRSILLFVCLMVAFASCENKAAKEDSLLDASKLVNNPKNSNGTLNKDTSNLPFLHLTVPSTHDFGKIQEGEKVQTTFTFTNTGQSPLLISNTETSCGCTVSECSKEPIQPGGAGWIKATFDSYKRPGSFQKTLKVYANTYPNVTNLVIIGDVVPQD